VSKVNFLGVVIGLEGIKIEEKKVKAILISQFLNKLKKYRSF